VIGLTASARRGAVVGDLRASGAAMSAWMKQTYGAKSARFVDHSGLGDTSRLSAADMVSMLARVGAGSALHAHMKEVAPKNADGAADPAAGHAIQAKTGSLNFVSSLAGYVTTADDVPLAFAVFTGDTARRAGIARDDMERPDGARAWARRSRWLQHQLINRWAGLYGA